MWCQPSSLNCLQWNFIQVLLQNTVPEYKACQSSSLNAITISNYNVTANRLSIDVSVTNLNDNPFGQALSGSLTLRGLVHWNPATGTSSLAGCPGVPAGTENIKCCNAIHNLRGYMSTAIMFSWDRSKLAMQKVSWWLWCPAQATIMLTRFKIGIFFL